MTPYQEQGVPTAAAAVDLSVLMSQTEGDLELIDEICATLREQVPGWLDALRIAISTGDAETTYRVAHAVKGTVSAFGGEAARHTAEELEMMGRRGSLDGAPRAFDRLDAGLRELVAVLDAAPWKG